jgi:DNA polymerase-3 subunit gamma/tau
MVMLRMLAFRPQTADAATAASSAASAPAGAANAAPRKARATTASRAAPGTAAEEVREAAPEPMPETGLAPAPAADPAADNWMTLVERLDIKGMARELALNCALQELSEHVAVLAVDPTHARLLSEARRRQIEQALGGHFGRTFSLKILQESEFRGETPARRQAREREARKQQAVQSIETDENVKALQDAFGATVNYDSIRPRE